MSKIIKAEKLNLHEVIQPKIEVKEDFSLLIEIKDEIYLKRDEGVVEEERKEESNSALEEVLSRAYEEGFKKGFEEGWGKGEKEGYEKGLSLGLEEAQKLLAQRERELEEKFQGELIRKEQEIEQFLKKAEEELRLLILNLDQEILKLALSMAQKLVLKDLEVDKEYLLRILREALNYIVEGTEIVIKVNPEEYSFLENKMEKRALPIHNYKVKIVSDASISKGGLFIETKMGAIDATLEKRWEKLLTQLENYAS